MIQMWIAIMTMIVVTIPFVLQQFAAIFSHDVSNHWLKSIFLLKHRPAALLQQDQKVFQDEIIIFHS